MDPSSFCPALKTDGPRTDVSIHSGFVKDVVGCRSYVRAACGSKFSVPIVRGDSSSAGNGIVIHP